MSNLTIGKLGKQTGTHIETIRYYERLQLIPEPERTPSGYRLYTDDFVRRLNFIKRAKELGFKLEEIKGFLELRIEDRASCKKVKRKIDHKVAEVNEKMKWLSEVKASLERFKDKCDRTDVRDCPFLTEMEGAS